MAGDNILCGRLSTKSFFLRGFFFLILCWIFLFGLMSVLPVAPGRGTGPMSSSLDAASADEFLSRLDSALKQISSLKRNNAEMKAIIEGAHPEVAARLNPGASGDGAGGVPSAGYEDARRQSELLLKEFWYNLRSKKEHPDEMDFEQVQDIYRVLRAELGKLREKDGFESFREKETKELAEIVEKRLQALQNPKDCDNAKKLLCSLNKGCGFGCQVHHVCYCLVVAYATGRTLILESRGWRYNRAGWEKVFLPLSNTCTDGGGSSRGDWNGVHSDIQVLQLPIVDFVKPKPPFLPVAIPSDIASRLEVVHGEPHVWWVGQFMKFILRPQPQLKAMLAEAKSSSGIEGEGPVVGLHIRRTDKIGTEASYHNLKEYMSHAEEYFAIKQKAASSPIKRRVFIASDDPTVISEAQRSYPRPQWEILGDTGIAQSAALSQRYNGLNGIVRDVVLLSECDFLVCTFSSQVCRLAYELLQTKRADASERFVSLDDVYYYGGGIGLFQEALAAHKPRNTNELELEVGDKIGIAGNHWNGYSKGTNQRTRKLGLYPSYKARNSYAKIPFPEGAWWGEEGEVRKR